MKNLSSDSTACGAERGFSVIELLIVIAIVMIIAAMTIVTMDPVRQQQQADAAMFEVASQLRLARETAIEHRRYIVVSFPSNNSITLTRLELPAGATVLSTVPIQAPAIFMLTPGMLDTPDGFGNSAPIEFEGISGGPPNMMFQSDGTFVDAVGNYVNGTVFIGLPAVPSTARAVTVLGATGKIHMYKPSGTGWQQ